MMQIENGRAYVGGQWIAVTDPAVKAAWFEKATGELADPPVRKPAAAPAGRKAEAPLPKTTVHGFLFGCAAGKPADEPVTRFLGLVPRFKAEADQHFTPPQQAALDALQAAQADPDHTDLVAAALAFAAAMREED